jgi:hypothetical protein
MTEYHFDASNSITHNFSSTNRNQQSTSNVSSSPANINQSKHSESTTTGTIPSSVIPYNEEYIHKVKIKRYLILNTLQI